ncbi:proteasome subunit beta type-1 [Octopus vulgaris]|uniref:Proteasome subunit beta type-1 n=1 Tax=Octopus vulgaris TaxID=6645 RepID=A0AA36BX52_OCTVU|nr:proteasome subunit beta type-1 [Octopus vulgaris]
MEDYRKPVEAHFSPYAMNGGTVLGLSGADYAIIASDTRLSEGFTIHTRNSPKSYKVTDSTVLGCVGFHGDVLTLTKIIEARLKVKEPCIVSILSDLTKGNNAELLGLLVLCYNQFWTTRLNVRIKQM